MQSCKEKSCKIKKNTFTLFIFRQKLCKEHFVENNAREMPGVVCVCVVAVPSPGKGP